MLEPATMALAAWLLSAAALPARGAGMNEKTEPGGWIWISGYSYQRADLPQRYQVVDWRGRSTILALPKPGPLSPDGRRIAWGERDKDGLRVFMAELASAPALELQGAPRRIFAIELPPQGMRLDSYVSALGWSPDGQYLSLSVRDTRAGDVYLHRLADRQGNILEIECGADEKRQWSPDGRRYACGLRSKLLLFEPKTGGRAERFAAKDPSDFLSDLAWSPDSATIAFLHGRMAKGPEGGPATHSLETVSIESGKANVVIGDVEAVAGKDWTPGEVRWSPDGKAISFSTRGALFETDAVSHRTIKLLDASRVRTVKKGEFAVLDCPRWSLDGRALVFLSSIASKLSESSPESESALFLYDRRSKSVRKLLDHPAGYTFEVLPRPAPSTR